MQRSRGLHLHTPALRAICTFGSTATDVKISSLSPSAIFLTGPCEKKPDNSRTSDRERSRSLTNRKKENTVHSEPPRAFLCIVAMHTFLVLPCPRFLSNNCKWRVTRSHLHALIVVVKELRQILVTCAILHNDKIF